MQNYFEEIKKWQSNNNRVAIARVIKTWGSSPRPVGSVMLVNEDGKMAGSVSGGCVEGSVVKKSLEIIDAGTASRLTFGVS
ncbi:MAG: XdhC family protein, partial [Cytophagales bacterium]|nr:XdhC family protein [Cytophagales bacterium]